MTDKDLDIIAAKLAGKLAFQPRWLKLSAASKYASINVKKLKDLAQNGEIIGYSDPDSKRGDWIFDRESIDQYRLKPVQETNLRFQKILDSMEEYL